MPPSPEKLEPFDRRRTYWHANRLLGDHLPFSACARLRRQPVATQMDQSSEHDGPRYVALAYHRDGTSEKSQWTISEANERAVFVDAIDRGWVVAGSAWGIFRRARRLEQLGEAATTSAPLYVAIFRSQNAPAIWHGYPADHQRRPGDRPPESVVREWLTLNLSNLTPAKVAKLLAGKKCVLTG